MPTEHIVALLIAERDRLTRAIDALRGTAGPSGRTATTSHATAAAKPSAPVKRKMSAAGRKAIAEAARRRWALIKAGKAQSPFKKTAGAGSKKK